MRCNRIFGIDKDQETFVLSIVKEIVKTQKHWCGDKNDWYESNIEEEVSRDFRSR